MKFLQAFAILLVAVSLSSAVRIRDCGSKAKVDYKNIKVTGCSENSRNCIFHKGSTAQISIPFAPKTPVTKLKAEVHGVIAGVPIPFPLDKPEACGATIHCPVEANTQVTYLEGLPVKTAYPTMKLRVKWALVDQDGKSQVCLLIPVSLQ